MKTPQRKKAVAVSQKALRAIAREALANYFKNGHGLDNGNAHQAIAVLHAPQFKGE